MRKFLIAVLLLVPTLAFALDYTDVSGRYTDAPFSKPEAAGISVLTNLGVIQGDPDGAFSTYRQVNRAEKSKMLMIAALGYHPDPTIPNPICFSDVTTSDWFSPYVCNMKQMAIVQGYSDSMFHPERPVTLAEAVKMGDLIWKIQLPVYVRAPTNWYDPYISAAQAPGILIDGFGTPNAPLTRGRAVRLVAAFRAQADGQLDEYRLDEQGTPPVSSSSSSVASSSSSESSMSGSGSLSSSSQSSMSSGSGSIASSSSMSTVDGFPAASHFLVAGQRSLPIASEDVFASLEPVSVQYAQVKLKTEIDGIDTMFLLDSTGHDIGQLTLDKTYDPTSKTWRGTFTTGSGAYQIDKGVQRTLGIEARMKPRNQGGTSEEMVQVQSFTLTVVGQWSGNSYESGSDAGPFPAHQTAMGHITAVTNVGDAQGTLPLGPKSLLGAFSVQGESTTGATLAVEDLEFQTGGSNSVVVTNWQLGVPNGDQRWPCSVNDSTISCESLPDTLGTLNGGTQTFDLYGDVTLADGATDKDFQVSLNQPGDLNDNGAVRWTDGSGHFNWTELNAPLARGTSWK